MYVNMISIALLDIPYCILIHELLSLTLFKTPSTGLNRTRSIDHNQIGNVPIPRSLFFYIFSLVFVPGRV